MSMSFSETISAIFKIYICSSAAVSDGEQCLDI